MQSELPALYHIRRAPSRCRKKDAGIFRHRCFLTAGGLVPPASQNQRRHTRFMPQQHLTMQTAVSTSTLPTAKSNRRTVNEPCSRMVPGVDLPAALLIACGALRLTAPAASEFAVLPAFLRTALPGAGSCAGASGCRAACGVEIRDELLLHAVLHAQCRRPESPQRLCAGGGNRQAGENVPAARGAAGCRGV